MEEVEAVASKANVKYEFNVTYTKEDFIKLNKFYILKLHSFKFIYSILLFALLIIGVAIYGKSYMVIPFIIGFVVAYPIIIYFTIKSNSKKAYETSKEYNGLKYEFKYYDKYFEVNGEKSKGKINYETITLIVENTNYLYLFIDESQCFMINKSSLPNIKFIEFIKSKSHCKYKSYK
ncbi:MAG: YcxB family protein [Bacilli bacterium]